MSVWKKFISVLRQRKIRRQLRAAFRLIDSTNRIMLKEGWPRWKRKQFWRDFISRDDKRKVFLNLDEGKDD